MVLCLERKTNEKKFQMISHHSLQKKFTSPIFEI